MPRSQPNLPTGNAGLIAVDKMGNQILFLDPATFETVHVLSGFPARVHELTILPDYARAFVPIYGDGRHGANPNPDYHIAVIDLSTRRPVDTFSVAPFLAPHGFRWGQAGQLYCVCEDSGVITEITPVTGTINHATPTVSTNSHRIEVLSKLNMSPLSKAFPIPDPKLFYAHGACSLAPHMASKGSGLA